MRIATKFTLLLLLAVARYLKHFHRVDWNDPLVYHLTLNTGALCEKDVVHLILQAAPREEDLPTAPRIGPAERAPLGEAKEFGPVE